MDTLAGLDAVSFHRTSDARAGVAYTAHDRRLIALTALEPGTVVLQIDGISTTTPTRYSVQVGIAHHIAPPDADDIATMIRDFPWCFLNHSCAPTTRLEGRAVIVHRALQAGDSMTFDYNTTEATMAEPFACRCGSDDCLGWIRGADHLSADARAARAALLAPYLRNAG